MQRKQSRRAATALPLQGAPLKLRSLSWPLRFTGLAEHSGPWCSRVVAVASITVARKRFILAATATPRLRGLLQCSPPLPGTDRPAIIVLARKCISLTPSGGPGGGCAPCAAPPPFICSVAAAALWQIKWRQRPLWCLRVRSSRSRPHHRRGHGAGVAPLPVCRCWHYLTMTREKKCCRSRSAVE